MSIPVSQLSRLIPLCGLPEIVLGYIGQQAWTENLEPGEDLYADAATQDTGYLLKGRVSLQLTDGTHRVVEAGTTPANSPLVAPGPFGASGATCDGKVKLLRLPRELIDSIYACWWTSRQQTGSGIELKEDDLEDTLYMTFYQQIQAGGYELPSMPEIAVKIGRAVDNPNSSSDDLARIISADPPLAARLVRTANSPAFGGEKKIIHCRDAVTRLGYANTRNLVTSFVLKNLFTTDSPLIQQRMKHLWRHSRRVAAIAYILARLSPGLVPDQAMLAGLIHDIGAIPLLIAAADYPQLLDDTQKLDSVVDALKPELGALILRNWNFPQSAIDTVLHCDQWFRQTDQPATYSDLVIVAQLFSHIGTQSMQQVPSPDLTPAFHKIAQGKLNPMSSISIINEAEKEISAIEELLEGG
ncbi:HDOD domain-containing protein [Sedimenticola sp.]|uniref:HDOD domain-containing protein n=1 Tax=Sedimenticola sp. TaxID=1940285 RepID=UPI003D152943